VAEEIGPEERAVGPQAAVNDLRAVPTQKRWGQRMRNCPGWELWLRLPLIGVS